MTVKELIEALRDVPEHKEIRMKGKDGEWYDHVAMFQAYENKVYIEGTRA